MSSVNKLILIGNVGKDPEVKAMPSTNVKVVTCSLATTESWKDKSTGEKKENTTWHNLKVFEPLADIFERYVKKGSKIYVEGPLRVNEYEKDGVKMRYTEVLVRQLVLLDSPKKEEYPSERDVYSRTALPGAPLPKDSFDDAIPF